MRTSTLGLNIIKTWESCRLEAYKPHPDDVWTIGWGHTGEEVVEGLVWSQAQADIALAEDLRRLEGVVESIIIMPLTQNQFDALVSLVYNCGSAPLTKTLGALLNQGDKIGAAQEFPKWVFSGGKKWRGLLRRRLTEALLFSKEAF